MPQTHQMKQTTMSVVEDEYSEKIACFYGGREDGFHVWCSGIKAALTGKKIVHAISYDSVRTDITDGDLSLIISALGDNLLKAVQSCSTVKDA